jgi:hypothetical protein
MLSGLLVCHCHITKNVDPSKGPRDPGKGRPGLDASLILALLTPEITNIWSNRILDRGLKCQFKSQLN